MGRKADKRLPDRMAKEFRSVVKRITALNVPQRQRIIDALLDPWEPTELDPDLKELRNKKWLKRLYSDKTLSYRKASEIAERLRICGDSLRGEPEPLRAIGGAWSCFGGFLSDFLLRHPIILAEQKKRNAGLSKVALVSLSRAPYHSSAHDVMTELIEIIEREENVPLGAGTKAEIRRFLEYLETFVMSQEAADDIRTYTRYVVDEERREMESEKFPNGLQIYRIEERLEKYLDHWNDVGEVDMYFAGLKSMQEALDA